MTDNHKAKTPLPSICEALCEVLLIFVVVGPLVWFLPQVLDVWMPRAEAGFLVNLCVVVPACVWFGRRRQRARERRAVDVE